MGRSGRNGTIKDTINMEEESEEGVGDLQTINEQKMPTQL